MQDRVHRHLTAWLLGAAFALGGAAGVPGPAYAQAAQLQLRVDIPAGKHKSLRLRNVPAEARVAFAIQASRRVTVALLNENDASRYPSPGEALFTAPVERTLSFSVTIPTAGTYYMVFDNTRGDTPSQVQMVFRAASGTAQPPQPPTQPPPPPDPDKPSPLRRQPGMHEM